MVLAVVTGVVLGVVTGVVLGVVTGVVGLIMIVVTEIGEEVVQLEVEVVLPVLMVGLLVLVVTETEEVAVVGHWLQVGSAGTQTGVPVMTVVTAKQTGCAGAGAAWVRASKLAAAKNVVV